MVNFFQDFKLDDPNEPPPGTENGLDFDQARANRESAMIMDVDAALNQSQASLIEGPRESA